MTKIRILRSLPVRSAWHAAAMTGAVVIVACSSSAAPAGSLFDALFGGFAAPRPATYAYSNSSTGFAPHPTPNIRTEAAKSTGGPTTYCVRTCDGRYFPMNSAANATPVQTCSAMCPASDTKVFHGGTDIATAVDSKGERYSSLAKAFAYRKAVVPGCTCNGKDAFGLAPQDISADPTLRTGDIVATADGLYVYEIVVYDLKGR